MREIIMGFVQGEGRGVITTSEARALGCGDDVVLRLVRLGLLVRVTRGAFVSAAALDPGPDHPAAGDDFALREHRHLLRLDAVLRSYGKKVAASHQSAVLVHGLPVASGSLDDVHVVHSTRGRTARRRDGLALHTCELDDVITTSGGCRVVVPELAVLGYAGTWTRRTRWRRSTPSSSAASRPGRRSSRCWHECGAGRG